MILMIMKLVCVFHMTKVELVPQGVGVEKLLEEFDAVRKQHKDMKEERFNDDATYKGWLHEVQSRLHVYHVCTCYSSEAVRHRWRSGSALKL
jgi:hypothetical protein